MRLPRIEYHAPKTVGEACALLRQHNGGAKVMAGGTDLLVNLKQRILPQRILVDIKGIGDLSGIALHPADAGQEGQELRIGALTSIRALWKSPQVDRHSPMLAQAARLIATDQLQRMGTIGGNICLDTRCWYYNQSHMWRQSRPPCFKLEGEVCHVASAGEDCFAIYSGDTAAPLMALGARVRLVGPEGERLIPVREFFSGDGVRPNSLRPDEILTEVLISPAPAGSSGVYKKLRLRGAIDFPLAGVAVHLSLEEDRQTCRDIRIILNAVDVAPKVAVKAEEFLRGKRLDEPAIEQAGTLAQRHARPFFNTNTSPGYRRRMIKVLTHRGIKEAMELAGRKGA